MRALIDAVWAHAPYRGDRLVILLALADRANKHALCWPLRETLAKQCHCSQRALDRHLPALERDGWITRRYRPRHSTIYELHIPDNLAGIAAPFTPDNLAGIDDATPDNLAGIDEQGDVTPDKLTGIPPTDWRGYPRQTDGVYPDRLAGLNRNLTENLTETGTTRTSAGDPSPTAQELEAATPTADAPADATPPAAQIMERGLAFVAWGRAKQRLRRELTEAQMASWIDPLRLEELARLLPTSDEGSQDITYRLTLEAPGTAHAASVMERYAAPIGAALAAALHQPDAQIDVQVRRIVRAADALMEA